MNIVVTDGFSLNPGDLDWAPIEKLGNLQVFDRTPAEQIIPRCQNAEAVLTNKVPFSRETLAALPQLRLICVLATGYNNIDTEAARRQGIAVCNVPAYGTASVAQHTFALLLELTNHVGRHAQSVAEGQWSRSADWCYTVAPITELAGKTMGIVGFGNIGRQTAVIARAFGMKVRYYSRTPKATELATYAGIEELFAQSDVVSLHCPLTPDNQGFVNRGLLRLMKKSAFLINTARGALIQENDLADALNEGLLAGAGLDVLSSEPPAATHPLLHARNCLLTPHNAWISKEARERILQATLQNLEAFIHGKPVNLVN